MSQLYVLIEHASGYALFNTTEFEELSVLSQQVQESLLDLSKFRGLVQLIAFMPFKSSRDALDNMNSISEGILHQDLQLFLETNMPKSKKKKKQQQIILGVSDPKLGLAITEVLGLQCHHTDAVPEILRGIRLHFVQLVSGFTAETSDKSQLALALNYSRAKVKFNINRVDNMIIQGIALLDQLDKDLNTFTMRIREWYSFHFPELIKVVPENVLYAQVVAIIKDRNNMPENIKELLEEVLMDSDKVDLILKVAGTSMGMDISEMDLINIENFCLRVISLLKYRQSLMEYMKDRMQHVAPNLASLIGDSVAARLISHAGSLTNLAKYPASTVQILGAEKALFRALKTRGNTPKYGLIFHSTFIGRAAKENKGRISRYLANKCSIASRIDCFTELPNDVFGKVLKQQVEDRLKFYDTGDIPAKNLEIMSAASTEAAEVQEQLLKKKRKRERKEKKRLQASLENSDLGMDSSINVSQEGFDKSLDNFLSPKKKKRSMKSDSDVVSEEAFEGLENGLSPKKKKKRSMNADSDVNVSIEVYENGPQKKKKKKHSLNAMVQQADDE